MISLVVTAALGLLPPILDKLNNKLGAIVSAFAGFSSYLFILAFEGKINVRDGLGFLIWGLLGASAPAFILAAILYSKSKSKKARNAAYVGAVIGAGTSIYVWTRLARFGV